MVVYKLEMGKTRKLPGRNSISKNELPPLHFTIAKVRFGILLACGHLLHDLIISLRGKD